jgi:hypothetical protein
MRGRDLGDLGVNRGARLSRNDRLLSSGDASLVRSTNRAVYVGESRCYLRLELCTLDLRDRDGFNPSAGFDLALNLGVVDSGDSGVGLGVEVGGVRGDGLARG